ncbi:hypothetical protein [Lonepinella sp. BR2919]|uniref:hypothetical protein n=1 Tax=unclassified Lonepinella TaxID=2642006 RepID=UPI003F6DAD67
MVRPAEASNAEWSEINFNQKLWTIPVKRIKKQNKHIVPLSEILNTHDLRSIASTYLNEYELFISPDVIEACLKIGLDVRTTVQVI